ncbi:glycosyltransferase family 1 protein [Fluviispira sanaruensis]|uniref:Glycosyltransferase family 1 protein n=2 Tax=Fluviispira sanaruensis TaxID=2493639 RepID=A0A4P2VSE2_FLUSA|nr:glycosyltransferase family 1 protein [Fluviispira sanaruensis]
MECKTEKTLSGGEEGFPSLKMKSQNKIAIVVQRCGININAGAEVYALKLAEGLALKKQNIEILTSQSDDYISWNNKLPTYEDCQIENNNFQIKRFPVQHDRQRVVFGVVKRFIFFTQKYISIAYKLLSPLLDYIFLKSQGPWCPKLWEYLENNAQSYSLIIVKSYLYAPNYYAIRKSHKKTKVLFIVTAHNEPEFNLNFVNKMIENSDTLAFVSIAEKNLCYTLKPFSQQKPYIILPPGFNNEIPVQSDTDNRILHLSDKKFFTYIGRIDKNKNVNFIFENTPKNCLVVFAGELKIEFPKDERFVYLGRVSEREKFFLLEKSIALLMVSMREAYSIITAEAIKYKCLVLALRGCEPIEELIERYGGYLCTEENYSEVMLNLWNNPNYFDRKFIKSDLINIEKSYLHNADKIINLT